METKSLLVSQIGSPEVAKAVFDRMFHNSKAYRELVGRPDAAWRDLPLITKKNFFSQHPWRDFVPKESFGDIYCVQRSSGTSTEGKNRGFFWPQLKSVDSAMAPIVHSTIVRTFDLDKRKTLVIIGLSLGSWAGGEQYSFIFKTLALKAPFPLVVFSPGNQHLEILEIIEKCHQEFDQIVIGVCPSAIFYLERLAAQAGVELPLNKIAFLVTGEPFPEAMRSDLQKRSGHAADRMPMLSVYGSADTGILGVESLPLIEARRFLSARPEVARRIGFTTQSIPNLYHAQTEGSFMEVISDELIVTKWQGVPLVRYNLEDRVQFFSWRNLCERLAVEDSARSNLWLSYSQLPLTDVIAVSGRSQGCLFLCGSNIFESMLQEVILQSGFRDRFSGTFVVWTEVNRGQQKLHWQIEIKEGAKTPQGAELESLHAEFVTLLSLQQPEFGDDYEKFYRPAEKDGARIFEFHFSLAPHLSAHPRFSSSTKRKVVIEQGPI